MRGTLKLAVPVVTGSLVDATIDKPSVSMANEFVIFAIVWRVICGRRVAIAMVPTIIPIQRIVCLVRHQLWDKLSVSRSVLPDVLTLDRLAQEGTGRIEHPICVIEHAEQPPNSSKRCMTLSRLILNLNGYGIKYIVPVDAALPSSNLIVTRRTNVRFHSDSGTC